MVLLLINSFIIYNIYIYFLIYFMQQLNDKKEKQYIYFYLYIL